VRIDIPTVLVDLRAQVVDAHRSAPGHRGLPKAEALAMKAAGWSLSDGPRLGVLARMAGLGSALLAPRLTRRLPGGRPALGRLPGPGARLTGARDLPLPPKESFRAWWRRTGGDR
jgi:L-lactate dehydrogenase complex protein LldF